MSIFPPSVWVSSIFFLAAITINTNAWATSCEKVSNDLSRCHTERRMGARGCVLQPTSGEKGKSLLNGVDESIVEIF